VANNLSGPAGRTIRALFSAGTIGGLTDGQLIERFTSRDADGAELAFAGLVERHGPMVLRVCRSVLRDAHLAEDAFQATFLILALKAGSIRGQHSLTSWLYSVAYNVAAKARSSAARRRSHELKAAQTRPLVCTEDTHDDLGPVIHEELDRIPERHRSVLVLCCLEGLTQHQAAQQLGLPLGTVQSRLARGRERLRARLERRGLNPASAVLALPLSTEAAHVVLPATLTHSTVRLALTIGAARALAIAVVPVAVMNLAKGVVRTMFVKKALTTGVAALLAAGVIATGAVVYAYQDGKPDPAVARPAEAAKREQPAVANVDDGLLSVTGIVRMRDGSPVAGATVRSNNGSDEPSSVTRTDASGRFQLQGLFGYGARLHAKTADGKHQTVLHVQSGAARTAFASPLELTLSPSLAHGVAVLSEGRPVAGAQVAVSGAGFEVHGVSGPDGNLQLQLPANGRISKLVAWHPYLGVNGAVRLENRPPKNPTQLSLLRTGLHKIHAVDIEGRAIGGLELGVSFGTENSDGINTGEIEAAHVRTDAEGWAIVPWAPRENLKAVGVRIVSSEWKVDETDRKQISAGITTVHARRERTVQGRLIMSDGVNADGILVTGFGFGPANTGDIPYARARRDGTFTLLVASEHGYVLGITDLKWASDPWSGIILGKGSTNAAEITMKVYPATPLVVRVTRGLEREPVVDAGVDLRSLGHVAFTDSAGKKQTGVSGAHTWLTTDAKGTARAGVGKGKQQLRLSSGNWNEERTVEVNAEKPVEVEFHRPWTGDQRITGRLMIDGAHFAPSPSLVARAWTPQEPRIPLTFEPAVHPDGTFDITFDAETVSLFFVDRDQQRSGYAERVHGTAPIEIAMEAMAATYGGTLLDENARPMADRTLQIYVKQSTYLAVAPQQTDKRGRFRFTGVPCNVPLQMNIQNENDGPQYFLFDRDRMLNSGEVRENDRLKPQRIDVSSSNARSAVPLAKSVENICRNARSSGMRALVAMLGDDSQDAAKAIDQLFDDDDERMRAVLSYLTLSVDRGQLQREATTITEYGWPQPAPGEIVLVALDGDKKTIAAQRIATKNAATAVGIGADFLKQHKPPAHNAQTLLAEARNAAKRSGRRVWVIEGGPRCGPCFRLARWIEDRHATLEKDYVIVKLMAGIDEHVTEAIAGLPIKDGDGIPWFAITEPDGAVLAISRGPLGNIGFPSSVEDIRHFRQMLERTNQRITSDELDRLVNSLSSGK
jgi:RNA polymerase sigma factor (sigma-70 family)